MPIKKKKQTLKESFQNYIDIYYRSVSINGPQKSSSSQILYQLLNSSILKWSKYSIFILKLYSRLFK